VAGVGTFYFVRGGSPDSQTWVQMSYQVLARKWRPGRFPEIVGQEHVLRAIINALNNQRLHHAYLFTGTRGVGKTTLARILAKCLNCEEGVSSEPCGVCSSCEEIAQGRFIDLIEVDAASRTKVDDTRELLDNVQYAPTRGRYKVYLIDEVHMLSTHSFNALLKTLEEPPPHVKFLLATTDPQKLPVTVLSRCLQFNLKRVSEDLIEGHLEKILKAEALEFESHALRPLAQAAQGSLRDALSLLDQAIAFGNGTVKDADVGLMLGSISRRHLYSLMEAVATGDAETVMQQVDALAEMAPDYDSVLANLITMLHDLALAQHIPGGLALRESDVHALSSIAAHMSAEEIQLDYEIAIRGRRDLPLIPDPRNALEMTLLRMLAFRPAKGDDLITAQKPAVSSGASKAPKQSPPKALSPVQTVNEPPLPSAPDVSRVPGPETWGQALQQANLSGMVKALANHCMMRSCEHGEICLILARQHESLLSDKLIAKLTTALNEYYGEAFKLKIELTDDKPDSPAERQRRDTEQRQLEAEAAIAADPLVDDFKQHFDAEVIPGSIKPSQ